MQTNRFAIIAPAAQTVATATARAMAQEFTYLVKTVGEKVWTVAHREEAGRSYEVCANPFAEDEAFPLTCTCPACLKSGYCKHIALVEQHEALCAAEADAEERYGAMGEAADAAERYWSR